MRRSEGSGALGRVRRQQRPAGRVAFRAMRFPRLPLCFSSRSLSRPFVASVSTGALALAAALGAGAVVLDAAPAKRPQPDIPQQRWQAPDYEPRTPLLPAEQGGVPYGTGEAAPAARNPMRGAEVSVSGQWSDRVPKFVNDGRIESNNHWACETFPAVLTAKLREPANVAGARLWFFFGAPRVYKFFVETSADGAAWERVADWSDNRQPSSPAGFYVPFKTAVTARFVRVTVTDSSVRTAGAHIVEFELVLAEDAPKASAAAKTAGTAAKSPDPLRGRVAPLARIYPDNATGGAGAEARKTWRDTAWRGERVNAQFVVWSRTATPQLRLKASALRTAGGAEIPANALTPRFVRYVLADKGRSVGDILDDAEAQPDLPAGGFRPVWLTVRVPADAAPGTYTGTLEVTGSGSRTVAFPLELEVLPARLPAPKDWSFFLDLWQHPWAVARYHGVKPYTPAHYALMEPILRELADAGGKTLTVSITNRPWNQQTYDPFGSTIGRVLNADGTWTFDYTLFDEYVAFGLRCGLTKQIHCYTMVPWGNRVFYTDGATGDTVSAVHRAGTAGHEKFWAPFLADFEKHLREKGWLDRTFIALDERSPEELRATMRIVSKHAPSLKIQMAGNHAPSHYGDITVGNYSQAIRDKLDVSGFIKEVKTRRAAGHTTTFYICCFPGRPNTFTHSPCAEQVWLGYYAANTRFDGMLRWSFVSWPREPLWDTSFPRWAAGDTFLLYPGPRSSVRWEMFRDGVEEHEKIRLLRERLGSATAAGGPAGTGADANPAGASTANPALKKLETVLGAFTYDRIVKEYKSLPALETLIENARAAVTAASRELKE